jgi:hypothetical protein
VVISALSKSLTSATFFLLIAIHGAHVLVAERRGNPFALHFAISPTVCDVPAKLSLSDQHAVWKRTSANKQFRRSAGNLGASKNLL